MSLRSKYDYEGMSNVERYVGRELHNQDVAWLSAKVLLVVAAVWVVYLVKAGDLNLNGVREFLNYLR